MSVVDCLCVRLNSLDHDGDVKSLATTSLTEIFFFFFFFKSAFAWQGAWSLN